MIGNLQEYYGNAIKSSKTLDYMKQACWATDFYKCSTDSDPQHGLYPLGGDSWWKSAAHGLP